MSNDSSDVSLGVAETGELSKILSLLERCALPTEGLVEHLPTILVARSGKQLVGTSALEIYQECALLRSVAVEPSFRERGIGQSLVRAALNLAKRRGVMNLYLLTETESFFSKLGFKAISRSDVPPKVHRSIEFTTLCPDTTLVMMISMQADT